MVFFDFFFGRFLRSLSLSLESEESEESEEDEEEEVEASSEELSLSLSLLLELELELPPAVCFLAPWSNARSHHASPQSVAGVVALLAPT